MSVLHSNVIFSMEKNEANNRKNYSLICQSMQMNRDDKDLESKCVCNMDVIGLVKCKKNDGSQYKEVCVIQTLPAVAACVIMSLTIFCCGCPK